MPDPARRNDASEATRLLRDGTVVASGEDAVTEAARLLRAGEVVAIPTDTVYGLAASPDAAGALAEIFRIKGRPQDRTLPVLVDDVATVGRLMADPSAPSRDDPTAWLLRLASQHWPGALTVAVPARDGLAREIVAADGTTALRVPDHAVARRVIALAGGALAVTSANRSGQPPALDADTIGAQFSGYHDSLRWVLDGGPATGGQASMVIGCDGDQLVIHRVGAIDPDALGQAWQDLHGSSPGPVR